MSEFEARLPTFRLVQTHFGDTMQDVAARELGDANRWIELVWLNKLTYPYLTDSDDERPGVIHTGQSIRIPAPVGVPADTSSGDDGFERDCALVGKKLVADEFGDFLILSGTDNLKQQLTHRVDTPMGQARRHPSYGCRIWKMLGKVNGPLAGSLGAGYVKSAIRADYRVSQVIGSTAEVVGDTVRISTQVEAISGSRVGVVTTNS